MGLLNRRIWILVGFIAGSLSIVASLLYGCVTSGCPSVPNGSGTLDCSCSAPPEAHILYITGSVLLFLSFIALGFSRLNRKQPETPHNTGQQGTPASAWRTTATSADPRRTSP